jgi:hypothetical protein
MLPSEIPGRKLGSFSADGTTQKFSGFVVELSAGTLLYSRPARATVHTPGLREMSKEFGFVTKVMRQGGGVFALFVWAFVIVQAFRQRRHRGPSNSHGDYQRRIRRQHRLFNLPIIFFHPGVVSSHANCPRSIHAVPGG